MSFCLTQVIVSHPIIILVQEFQLRDEGYNEWVQQVRGMQCEVVSEDRFWIFGPRIW